MEKMKNKSFKHWMVLVACCGLSAASMGLIMNAVGVFFTPVSEGLGIMRGTFAGHATVSLIFAAVTFVFIPSLMKKYSYKLILWVSVLLASGSTILMGFSTTAVMFYVLGAIRGMSSAFFAIVPLMVIINQWFEKKHGLATGIVLSFNGVISAIFSPIFASLIESYGWETTYIIKGIVLFLVCLPAMVYPFALNPKDDGLLPYGAEGETEKEETEVNNKNAKFKLLQVSFICFIIFSTLVPSLTAIGQHLPGFAESIGHDAATGAMLLSAVMMGNIISKLIIGAISDVIGPLKASLIMMAINTVGVVILLTATSIWLIVLGSFLFGALFSVGSVGIALLTKYFFGLENYTKAYPIISIVGGVGIALMLALVGFLYDFTGTYETTFMMALVSHGISLILLTLAVLKMQNVQNTEKSTPKRLKGTTS